MTKEKVNHNIEFNEDGSLKVPYYIEKKTTEKKHNINKGKPTTMSMRKAKSNRKAYDRC